MAKEGLSVAKKLLFSLVAVLVFFAGLELLLAVGGVDPILVDEDPFLGFGSSVPTFEAAEDDRGQVVLETSPGKLAYINPQSFTARKPGNTYRIFSLGGSTTHGRPYGDMTSFSGWLRRLLPAADPSTRYEVINCGGVSYASYRAALLMEELVAYEPDLFLVYTGHNEFLEDRTYGDLRDTSPVISSLRGQLLKTRIYAATRRLLKRDRPEPHRESRPVLTDNVQTLLDRSVGLEAYERDEEKASKILQHFEFTLHRMVDIARGAGASLLLVTPASNLGDCSPFKSEPDATLSPSEIERLTGWIQESESHLDQGAPEDAVGPALSATELAPRSAQALYQAGRSLRAVGRVDEARDLFVRAREEDVCPLRALDGTIEIVRQVATEPDVMLVDFVRIVEDESEDRIPGKSLFVDHVHPNIEGHRILALAILDALAHAGEVGKSTDFGPDAIARVAADVEASRNRRSEGLAFRNLAKVLGWAGKHEEALEASLEAVRHAPKDPEAQLLVGSNLVRENRVEEALPYLEKANQLNPRWPRGLHNLAVALMRLGRPSDAEGHLRTCLQVNPELAGSRYLLALSLEEQGRREAAIRQLEKILATQPKHEKARRALDRMRGS